MLLTALECYSSTSHHSAAICRTSTVLINTINVFRLANANFFLVSFTYTHDQPIIQDKQKSNKDKKEKRDNTNYQAGMIFTISITYSFRNPDKDLLLPRI